MLSIGEYIQELRLSKGNTLPEVAAFLDMDVAFLSNIEQGRRNATKDQVIKLASYFDADERKMLITYLNGRILQVSPTTGASKRYQNMLRELGQLNARQMQARIHKPSFPLDAYIENITYYNGNNKDYPYERVLPDGVVQIVIALDENERVLMSGDSAGSHRSLKKAWITGVQKQHITYQLERNEITLCIRFAPGGFYALTNIPLTEIENAVIDADLIFGAYISSLRERILCCTDINATFRAVEQYFLKGITKQANEYSVVRYLYDNINTPLHRLIQQTGYSQKHIIHLFKKHVGISPKYFQRICRFNKVLNDILSTTQEVDWWDIVFDNNYFDQPHFIKEFRHFTGMSPQCYIETGGTCSKFIHLNSYR